MMKTDAKTWAQMHFYGTAIIITDESIEKCYSNCNFAAGIDDAPSFRECFINHVITTYSMVNDPDWDFSDIIEIPVSILNNDWYVEWDLGAMYGASLAFDHLESRGRFEAFYKA